MKYTPEMHQILFMQKKLRLFSSLNGTDWTQVQDRTAYKTLVKQKKVNTRV